MLKPETIDREQKLVLEVKKGNKEAFGELYDLYAPKLFRFIRLKVNSQVLAEDLSSESFLRIWEYLKEQKREIEESFQALLYKTARNLIADYYKKKSSQEIFMDDDFREFLSQEPAKDEINSKEIADQIHKALTNIKEEYQNVLIWYYVEELSVPEIAKIMDKSQGAVRVLIHRGLRSLKDHLSEQD
ncbi:MAG: sigma-70 family RNA polymerase sigma factor [Phycisphaerae bacterium]|nr:sigma-70 family RNA polymerase sigma factor [Phycisphaerae bacterium]